VVSRDPSAGRQIDPGARRDDLVRRFTITPFMRLSRVHALLVAGDAAVAVALAGSLFFDVDATEARGKVALYLLLTLAPFSIVAPLIGPAIDRMAGGRRLMVLLSAAGRGVLALVAVGHLDSLLLYPLAFVLLVLAKAYAVAKSALVPTVVRSDAELVEANSKLGVIAGVVGVAAALPALLLKLAAAELAMAFAALLFCAGVVTAVRLPRRVVVAAEPTPAAERAELRSLGIVLAASAMAFLRATVGFLFFHVAFWFRSDDIGVLWFGLAAVFSALGSLAGNATAPLLRQSLSEERILVSVLGLTAVAGLLAGVVGGTMTAAMLACTVGYSAAAGRLAFDAIVQRDAPDANRGRAFARFETKFQLAWVAAAFVPVAVPIPGDLGLLAVSVLSAIALGSYLFGANYLRRTGRLPPSLKGRAWREVQRRRQVVRERTDPRGVRRTGPALPDPAVPSPRIADRADPSPRRSPPGPLPPPTSG
jgi:hypothetical protein